MERKNQFRLDTFGQNVILQDMDLREQIVKLHKNGYSKKEIADALGISLFVVSEALYLSGINTVNLRKLKEMLSLGYTIKDIAKAMDVSRETLYKVMKENGIDYQRRKNAYYVMINGKKVPVLLDKEGRRKMEALQSKLQELKKKRASIRKELSLKKYTVVEKKGHCYIYGRKEVNGKVRLKYLGLCKEVGMPDEEEVKKLSNAYVKVKEEIDKVEEEIKKLKLQYAKVEKHYEAV